MLSSTNLRNEMKDVYFKQGDAPSDTNLPWHLETQEGEKINIIFIIRNEADNSTQS